MIIKNLKGEVIFNGANLSRSDLSGANLSGANLYEANLSRSDLREADLSGANLYEANLSRSDLREADLSGADLSGANLCRSDLREANLSGANLSGANLCRSDLSEANLSEANLSGADLSGANLYDCKNSEILAITYIIPEGEVIGWKKCRDNVIVKLLIPTDAKRSNSTGRKCRAEYVRVLEVIGADIGVSNYNNSVTYKVGETVKCDKWDECRWNECSGGIHFFITRWEAENYQF